MRWASFPSLQEYRSGLPERSRAKALQRRRRYDLHTRLSQDNQDLDIKPPQDAAGTQRKTSLDGSLRAFASCGGLTICTNLTWSDLGCASPKFRTSANMGLPSSSRYSRLSDPCVTDIHLFTRLNKPDFQFPSTQTPVTAIWTAPFILTSLPACQILSCALLRAGSVVLCCVVLCAEFPPLSR